MKKNLKSNRHMTKAEIAAVVAEIKAYERGEREGELTWERLEEFSGFSSVAMWKKESIRLAFRHAKLAIRAAKSPKIKPRKTIDERIEALQKDLAKCREIINGYDCRWALAEANMERLGLSSSELWEPLDYIDRKSVKSRTQGNKRRGKYS